MRHALTTQHEFHLVVNPVGHEAVGSSDIEPRCRNIVRFRTAGMTPGAAATGEASTSKMGVFKKVFELLAYSRAQVLQVRSVI